jgi:superfamily II DNA or RNA helicase
MSRHVSRPYQIEAGRAVRDAWAGGMARPAYVLPTGEGKTQVIAAEIVAPWLAENPGKRALVVAHRIELIEQAADRLRHALDGVPVGVVMAGRNDTLPPVLVGSVQTLASERRRAMLRGVGLIVVDEAHRAAARSYVSLLRHFGAYDGRAVAVGCTATMSRSDDLALGDVWQDVVFRRTIGQAIRGEGNDGVPTLVRPTGIRVTVDDLDLRRVKTARGDYQDGSLGRALSDSMAPKRIAEAIREQCPDRQGIVFAPTVDSARVIMDVLTAEGFTAALVHGGTPAGERSAVLDRYRAGEVAWLCNCAVFTEGTDLPMASVCVIARPTKHSGLYIQMVGRVLRLWPGKVDALVLDVAGAAARHTLDARVELFGVEAADALEAPEVDPADAEPVDPEELIIESGVELDFDRDGCAYDQQGKLVFEIVDLFAGSDTAWSRTPRGVWYFPGHERFVCLLPADPARGGGVDVVTTQRWHAGCTPIALNVASLAEAQRVGESVIEAVDRTVARRRRGWRSQQPSEKSLAYAARLGLDVPLGAGMGEVSEMITAAEAERRIDGKLLPQLPWLTFA